MVSPAVISVERILEKIADAVLEVHVVGPGGSMTARELEISHQEEISKGKLIITRL